MVTITADRTLELLRMDSSRFTVPITFVEYVSKGVLYDIRTKGCAAR